MLSMLALLMMVAEPNAFYVATYVDVQLNSTNDGGALIKQTAKRLVPRRGISVSTSYRKSDGLTTS